MAIRRDHCAFCGRELVGGQCLNWNCRASSEFQRRQRADADDRARQKRAKERERLKQAEKDAQQKRKAEQEREQQRDEEQKRKRQNKEEQQRQNNSRKRNKSKLDVAQTSSNSWFAKLVGGFVFMALIIYGANHCSNAPSTSTPTVNSTSDTKSADTVIVTKRHKIIPSPGGKFTGHVVAYNTCKQNVYVLLYWLEGGKWRSNIWLDIVKNKPIILEYEGKYIKADDNNIWMSAATVNGVKTWEGDTVLEYGGKKFNSMPADPYTGESEYIIAFTCE